MEVCGIFEIRSLLLVKDSDRKITSTIASTGHASWQKPQKIHLVISISYLVVLLEPSGLGSDSMTIAKAGHAASHNLHAMHLSSPVGYLLSACSPLNIGERGPFSHG